jgi:hypothetical protein
VARLRDQVLRGDIRDARRGLVIVTAPDGSRRTDGSLLDDVKGRLLARLIIDWDADLGPKPGDASGELQQRILDSLPEADYAALEEAIEPYVRRVLQSSRSQFQFTYMVNGEAVLVEAPDAESAAKLAATGQFTQVESPKALTSQNGTGISSAALPSGREPATDPTP